MSDLPQLHSSSPTSSRAAPRPHTELAFLVHSPNTFAKDLPPDVDNRPLARQKRRRTSKEDEEVLKAEYQKNPKPDKAARVDIVRRVALGEKEVQIWFQNKRQNDRRRSRPFDSSSSIVLSSEASNMSDPVTEDDSLAAKSEPAQEPVELMPTTERKEVDLPEVTVEAALAEHSEMTAPSSGAAEGPMSEKDVAEQVVPISADSQSTAESAVEPLTDPRTVDTVPTEPDASQQSVPSSQDFTHARSSWISNRRSASFRYTEDYAPEVISFPNAKAAADSAETQTEQSAEPRSLKRAHSYVRLSMNDDGTARVITDADKTPSPPHARSTPSTLARAAAGLRRSYSSAGLNERLAAASRGEPSPKIPRIASNIGRSRDSRAWEFWCDPDTRNSRSLTTRADQEGSGSAADAIGLLRANRKILTQNNSRHNTSSLSRHGSLNMDANTKKKSRTLQRASTTHGRLQSKAPFVVKGAFSSSDSSSDDLPQTESDKENWEPGDLTQSSKRSRNIPSTPRNSQRSRQILGENVDIMSQSSSLGAMLSSERRERRKGLGLGLGKENEDVDPERDEELRTFMKGGSAEEAGCVEGLLKLSQGNWR